ncbi:hypothetical protein DRP44_02905 [candidate division TA06 bacterium]|uniref:Uncharacterized protein n=1 Tax=candidate division TA06 bacterium TaxID=2250710 RepID=A0A660S931_UNCT6|nr:MAG: hypothetical protein DRP44_02905 [candidate division TA06 bacterium]
MISVVKIVYFLYLLKKDKTENLKLEDRDYIMYFIIFSYLRFLLQRVKSVFIYHGGSHFNDTAKSCELGKNNIERKNMYVCI